MADSSELDSDYFNTGPSDCTNNDLYEKGSYSNSTDTNNMITSIAGERVSVDLSRTRVMLNNLAPHGNEQVTDLKGDVRKNFNDILEISKYVHTTPNVYNKLFAQVKEVFYEEYPHPIPGTVAAFFISCIVTTGDFKGPQGCDPRCTGSLPPPSGKKCTKCDQVCLLYDERSVIRPLNNIKNGDGTGYIVVLGKNFKGFTDKDLKTFERKGITKKVVLLRFYDGKYQEQTCMIDVCELPKCNGKGDSGSSGLSTGVVIVIIIVIIIAMLILFFWYRRSGNRNIPKENYIRPPPGYTGKLRYY